MRVRARVRVRAKVRAKVRARAIGLGLGLALGSLPSPHERAAQTLWGWQPTQVNWSHSAASTRPSPERS